MRTFLTSLSSLLCLATAMGLSVSAADPPLLSKPIESPQFLRLHRNEDGGPVALDVGRGNVGGCPFCGFSLKNFLENFDDLSQF